MNYILLISASVGGSRDRRSRCISGEPLPCWRLAPRPSSKRPRKRRRVIKKNKLLEVKEKFIHMKAEMEKQANARTMPRYSRPSRNSSNAEMQLSQQQQELQTQEKRDRRPCGANLDSQTPRTGREEETGARETPQVGSRASGAPLGYLGRRGLRSVSSSRSRRRPKRRLPRISTTSWTMPR